MDISKAGMCELGAREGLCLTPYLDSVGVKTVGFGSTKSDIPDLALWDWKKEITIEEAVRLYKTGLSKYVAAVNRTLTKLDIAQHKFDALVSICYNIGEGGLAGSTFMRYINAGRSDQDVVKAIKMWNKPPEIVGRRQQECDLFVNGIYHSGGMVALTPVDTKTHKELIHQSKQINLLTYLQGGDVIPTEPPQPPSTQTWVQWLESWF